MPTKSLFRRHSVTERKCKMKICPNCKKENADEAKTCEFCAFSFENSVQGSATNTQNAQNSNHHGVFSNIKFYLGFPRMMVISFVFLLFCALAIWFFVVQRLRFLDRHDLRQSCTIMVIIFSIFALVGLICLVMSIIFNIQKQKKKKTDQK